MKTKLAVLILALSLGSGLVACNKVEEQITSELETVDREVEAILGSSDLPEHKLMLSLYNDLRKMGRLEDKVYDISKYPEKDVTTFRDSNANILCHMVIDKEESSVYVVVPDISKTIILDGSIVEDTLYELIEMGTGLSIGD